MCDNSDMDKSLAVLERRRAQIAKNERQLRLRQQKIRGLRRKWKKDMRIRLQKTVVEISQMNVKQLCQRVKNVKRLRSIGKIKRKKAIKGMRNHLLKWNSICNEREYLGEVLGLLKERLKVIAAISLGNAHTLNWQSIKVQNLLKRTAGNNKQNEKKKCQRKLNKKKAKSNTKKTKTKKLSKKKTQVAKIHGTKKAESTEDKINEYVRLNKLAYRSKIKRPLRYSSIVRVMPTVQEAAETEVNESSYEVAHIQALNETEQANMDALLKQSALWNKYPKRQEAVIKNEMLKVVKRKSEAATETEIVVMNPISFAPCITTAQAALLSTGQSMESLITEETTIDKKPLENIKNEVEEVYGTMMILHTPAGMQAEACQLEAKSKQQRQCNKFKEESQFKDERLCLDSTENVEDFGKRLKGGNDSFSTHMKRNCQQEAKYNQENQDHENILERNVERLYADLTRIVKEWPTEASDNQLDVEINSSQEFEEELQENEEESNAIDKSDGENKAIIAQLEIEEEEQSKEFEGRLQRNEDKLRQIYDEIAKRKEKLEQLEKARVKALKNDKSRYYEVLPNCGHIKCKKTEVAIESELTIVLQEAIRRANERAIKSKENNSQETMKEYKVQMTVKDQRTLTQQDVQTASSTNQVLGDNNELYEGAADVVEHIATEELLVQTEYQLACAKELAESTNLSLRRQEVCLEETECLRRKIEEQRKAEELEANTKAKMRRINMAAINLALAAGMSLEECKLLYGLETIDEME